MPLQKIVAEVPETHAHPHTRCSPPQPVGPPRRAPLFSVGPTGPVFTPPELRRRGYASALTAGVSAWLLEQGRQFCFLYTGCGWSACVSWNMRIEG